MTLSSVRIIQRNLFEVDPLFLLPLLKETCGSLALIFPQKHLEQTPFSLILANLVAQVIVLMLKPPVSPE